jgi:RNA polymerase sigma-70 factor (ECF subfamily)
MPVRSGFIPWNTKADFGHVLAGAASGTSMASRLRDEFDRSALIFLPELVRVASRLCGSRDSADDLVQETYLQAWRSFHRFEPGTNCRAWLYKILLFSHARQQRRLTRRPIMVALDAAAEASFTADAPTPDTLTAASVKAAFDSLPQVYRVAVMLVDVEEFSYREAADALDVPIGTVMSRLNRGRRLLRVELAKQAAAFGITAHGVAVGEAGIDRES